MNPLAIITFGMQSTIPAPVVAYPLIGEVVSP
jgi:hypothetical protein